ncbi:MAG TPA: FAD-binding protein, partial [Armatimonadaceae bacterium]|nr:FAD-binding protein [Armatimonadaceae bacterium]
MTLPEIQENVPLGPRTTLGVGGPARCFASAASEDELRGALAWAGERGLPAFVLGGGSNLVVSDAGFEGLVVRVDVRGIEAVPNGDVVHVTAGAGEDWDGFVRHAVARGWQGVECLAGIPGGVGGTPVQNVGAYGQEVADTIVRVRALDRQQGGTVRDLDAAQCGFAYRRSRFNTDEMGRWAILSVTYALRPGASPAIKYA